MKKDIFNLQAPYKPSPDQKNAISQIVDFIEKGYKYQTLWGVTGSGKTFTMANVIKEINKPTLVIAHNKTLAAQLAQEFKEFFPNNAVHYFVSYYDYYQPEAYVAKTDTYIEKEATINEEIDRLRHAATQDLLTRRDVIIVASVSCIYGIGDIGLYMESTIDFEVGKEYELEVILRKLVAIQYKRAYNDFKPGNFQINGDVLEIFPASSENVVVIEFWGNEVTGISVRDNLTNETYERLEKITIFPAKHTVTTKEKIKDIIPEIQKELDERLKLFEKNGDILKHERLKTKVEYDMEMMLEVGYVNGIENYSRFLDGRKTGEAPATLIDYFGDDYLCFVDESHMTFSQVGGMYAGDRSRKENLVENGFRLPSALDNRPLKFPEFEAKLKSVVAVSATPGPYEIGKSCEISPSTSFQSKPHPNPLQTSPLTPLQSGEGEKAISQKNELEHTLTSTNTPGYVYELARELRQNGTESEKILWEVLRNRKLNGIKFRRQHPIGRYIADFYSSEAKLVIELDGKIHENQKEYDEIRNEIIEKYGLKVLRIKNEELEQDIEKVIHSIVSVASPLQVGEGLGVRFQQERGLGGEVSNGEGQAEKFFNFDPLKDGVWEASENMRIVPQMMRPTGLLDPEIILKPMEFMVDDIMKNISEIVEKNERMLVTTITKRSSEELSDYLLENGVKVKYLHSEVETLERLEILKELREGKIDVIVGVNLLREGLDLPEVSKICILDADKQGFLRSETSLIQIIGRAARNVNGKVYMYSEKLKKFTPSLKTSPNPLQSGEGEEKEYKQEIDGLYRIDKGKLANEEGLIVSEAMRKAINLTYYRRNLQERYNAENGITPTTIFSNIKDMGIKAKKTSPDSRIKYENDKINGGGGGKSFDKEIKRLELEMDIAATNLDFEKAAELRDLILEMKNFRK